MAGQSASTGQRPARGGEGAGGERAARWVLAGGSGAGSRGLSDLKPGDHLCCFYASDDEYRAVVTPFLRSGLERGEKLIYIVDSNTAEIVMRCLRDEGVDPEPFVARGQLVIATQQEAYLVDGRFDPDRMIALLRAETEKALAEGYPALRVTGEMTWALRGAPGTERLLEYESRLNEFFPGSRCLALCQYDVRRFHPKVLLDVMCTHPGILLGDRALANPFYLPPSVFLDDLPAARFNTWLGALGDRERYEGRLDQKATLLTTMKEINRLIVHESDVRGLLGGTCRIVVESGGFRMAWVGLADRATGAVRPAASAGDDAGYLDEIEVRCDDSPLGKGPTGTAIREARSVVVNDWASDASLSPWLAAGFARGYRSSAALPMVVAGRVVGAFTVYASEPHAFEPWRVEMLEEVVADLTFGLEASRLSAEQRAAEEALRISEERYRLLFERNVAGVFRSTVDGQLLECNDALAWLFGFESAAEFMAGTAWDVYPSPAAREKVLAEIRKTGQLRNFEHELRRRDGTSIWVLENAGLAPDETGAPMIIEGTLLDITERRRTEEQLRAAQRMETVGRLAGGIAHDFNNILQAMLSHTERLRRHDAGPEEFTAVLQELESLVRRGATLTRQLLLFSRHEAPRAERLDLNDVLRGSLQMLRRLIRANIEFVVQPEECALEVMGDRGQLEQLFMNLIVNASDAMPDGGRLEVRTGAENPHWVWFEVGDTGHGIADEIRDRIFEPFFTTKEAGLGTGLGLSVVHGIVHQHGGRITFTSTVGGGTTFRVTLPRLTARSEKPAQRATEVDQVPLPEGHGERILLVEDEDSAREALRDILIGLHYDVTAVRTGENAEALPNEPAYDVLLTDVMLPGVGGVALAQGLCGRWPMLRAILMSGYSEDELLRRGAGDARRRFLQKPFDMTSLAREIRAALADHV